MNPKQNKENENHTQRPTTRKLQNKTKKRYLRQPLQKRERLLSCVIIRMTDEVIEVIFLKCLMC